MDNVLKLTTFLKKNFFLILILLVLSLMRFYHIVHFDPWFDEIATAKFSHQNIEKASQIYDIPKKDLIINGIKNDPHSFLYFVIVYFYTYFYNNEFSLRILSAIFSSLALLMLYKLSRLFLNKETSLYAILLMGLSPFHLWYAQEARVYSMSCFFSILMIYLLFKSLKSDKTYYWISFIVASIFSILISYYSILLLIASSTILFFKEYRAKTKQWLYSLAIPTIVSLSILGFFFSQLSIVKNNFWLQKPSLLSILKTFSVYSLGYYLTREQFWAGSLIFMLLFLFGIYSFKKENKTSTYILLSFLLIPLGFVYCFSKMFIPIYLRRQLIIFSPYYYLFVAKGISSIPFKKEKIFTILFVSVFLTFILFKNYFFYENSKDLKINLMEGFFYKYRYRRVLETLNKEYRKGDLIICTGMQDYQLLSDDILKSNKIDPGSFYFYFIPKYMEFTKFSKHYLNVKNIETFYKGIRNSENIFYIKPFEQLSPEIKPMKADQLNAGRLWITTFFPHKLITSIKNSAKVKAIVEKNFNKTYSTSENYSITLDLYEKKGQ